MSPNYQHLRKELAAKKLALSRLEGELAAVQREVFKLLPDQLGFDNMDSLVEVLLTFATPALQARVRGGYSSPSPGRRRRAIVTHEMRMTVAEHLRERKRTAAEIGRLVGVSTSFVNKLNRSLKLSEKPPS